MRIEKINLSNSEIAFFKEQYIKKKLDIDTISNCLSEGAYRNSPIVNAYNDLFISSDTLRNTLISAQIKIHDMLKSLYGKEHFLYAGNKLSQNYILSYQDEIFIISSKNMEVIRNRNNNVTEDFLKKLVSFNLIFNQDLLLWGLANENDKLHSFFQRSVEKEIVKEFLSIDVEEFLLNLINKSTIMTSLPKIGK